MPDPPQLAPLHVEEERLYSQLLLGDPSTHPVPQGVLDQLAYKGNSFQPLDFTSSRSVGHHPKLLARGEVRI